jgi:organic radical activating enzyme
VEAVSYRVVEVFETVQGEGVHAGRAAVFIRFAGCNAWDGNPAHRDRSRGACGAWCDTEFRGGKTFISAEALAEHAAALRPRWAVLTGGEPLLQADEAVAKALRARGFSIAVETNGSISLSAHEHPASQHSWITCSPKRGMPLVIERADEIKVVLPGGRDMFGLDGWGDDELLALSVRFKTAQLFVQPQDPINPRTVSVGHLTRRSRGEPVPEVSGDYDLNVKRCLEFVLAHPAWRVGVQAHKMLGVR